MRKVVRWAAIVIGSIVALLLITGVALCLVGRSKFHSTMMVDATPPAPVTATDSVLARGEHLAMAISSCTGCHAADLGGQVLVDEPVFATVAASNITTGAGGLTDYTDADWDRAIRHGVSKAGYRLFIMPSHYFADYTDSDLAALIAWLHTVPPVDRETPARRAGPIGAILLALGVLPVNADRIDHDDIGRTQVTPGVDASYGEYLTTIAACGECHGEDLQGIPPDQDQGPPPGPSLVAPGRAGSWTTEQFLAAMRTGRTPDGRQLNPEIMPWPEFSRLTDDELEAIRLHLASRSD